jgi:hypothetical protein
LPDIARRQYETLRQEWVRLNSDGTVTLDDKGWDKIDTPVGSPQHHRPVQAIRCAA